MDWNDFEQRLRARLTPLDRLDEIAQRGDRDLNPDWSDPQSFREAAVLAPIVRRPEGWTMLFTERAADLPHHPGQVAFPGGRVEERDRGPLGAALRETEKEIGLSRAFITPLGASDAYFSGTGFRITPIVAFVTPGFELRVDPREVADVFETPVSFLMNPENHERREGEFRGRRGAYYAMPHEGRFIWGVTAGMIRALYERLYD